MKKQEPLIGEIRRSERIPLLAKEGWLRHQKNAAKPPQKAQTGWSLTRTVACERLLFLASPYRARIRSAHARPLLSKVASQHLLKVASTPPLQGGEYVPAHDQPFN